MTMRGYHIMQSLVLTGLGFYLLMRIMDGNILLYINRRFVLLVLFAGIALLVLAQARLQTKPAPEEEDDTDKLHHEGHIHTQGKHGAGFSGWGLAWMVIPLVLGVLVPPKPLGGSAAVMRGIQTRAPLTYQSQGGGMPLGLPPAERNILDWLRVFSGNDPVDALIGLPAEVTGFVHQDERLDEGTFMVGRFALTCCAADATAIGLEVAWPAAKDLLENEWVRVTGKMDVVTVNGSVYPRILAESVTPIPQPDQPYLYP